MSSTPKFPQASSFNLLEQLLEPWKGPAYIYLHFRKDSMRIAGNTAQRGARGKAYGKHRTSVSSLGKQPSGNVHV